MKKLFIIFFMGWASVALAQVAINTDGTTPDNSAMLDIKSTARGLLIPRMTQAQRNAIAGPANGLMVYQTDNTPGYYYNSGSSASPAWTLLGSGSGSGWSLSGNSLSGNEIIGSINNQPVKFYSNNAERVRITENGNIGIGTTAPAQKLSIGASVDDAAIEMTTFDNVPPPTETDPSEAYTMWESTPGTAYFVNESNIMNSDDVYSQAEFNGPDYTNYLYVSNFGFNIPIYATITGVEVFIERNSTIENMIQDHTVQLFIGTSPVGENKANTSYWTTTDLDNIYGSSNSLWGNITIEPYVINYPSFGVIISVISSGAGTANIDHIGVKVYYTDDHGWTTGMDMSDNYKFKVANSSALGTNDKFLLDLDGNAQFAGRVRGQNAVSNDEYITKGQLASGNLPSQWATSGTNIYNTNSGNVGIGKTNPQWKLDVSGSINLTTDSTYRIQGYSVVSTKGNSNTLIGRYAGRVNTGSYNTASGYDALGLNTTANRNTAIGFDALRNQSYNNGGITWNSDNVAIGYESLYNNQPTNTSNGNGNTAVGNFSLRSNTTGYQNTATGYFALYNNTTATRNTANGSFSLFSQSFSNGGTPWNTDNVAIGYEALYSNQPTSATNGYHNTAIGNYTLRSNTTGFDNTATGTTALYFNTTGQNNTANGRSSLYYNTSGNSNTAVGTYSLYSNTLGVANTALGQGTLFANTTANHNTAIGMEALRMQSFSNNGVAWNSENVAVGFEALYANQPTSVTNGIKNTSFGNYSLRYNTIGTSNTAMGYYALRLNTTGDKNTAVGDEALCYNISGDLNTAVGSSTLTASGTDSYYNTAVGAGAGYSNGNYTVSSSTFLGSYSGLMGPMDIKTAEVDDNNILNEDLSPAAKSVISNCMALGYGAYAWGSNTVMIGNDQVTSIGGHAGWTTFSSDLRFDRNIQANVPGLEFISLLKPVTYTLNLSAQHAALNKNRANTLRTGEIPHQESKEEKEGIAAKEKIVYTGFIAQDVEKAARAIGYDFSGLDTPKNENGYHGLRYAEFVVPLVKAVQEQQQQIEALQKEVEALREMVKKLSE